MKVDKELILQLLRSQDQDDLAARADAELPEEVDLEEDAPVLQRLGIDPEDLPGSLGGLAGGFG
jgi:hypothetical protein